MKASAIKDFGYNSKKNNYVELKSLYYFFKSRFTGTNYVIFEVIVNGTLEMISKNESIDNVSSSNLVKIRKYFSLLSPEDIDELFFKFSKKEKKGRFLRAVDHVHF